MNFFSELLNKWMVQGLSKDYRNGWCDGFRAGVRESKKTLSLLESISIDRMKKVKIELSKYERVRT